jgi:serine/threonine protein phosphatase 1
MRRAACEGVRCHRPSPLPSSAEAAHTGVFGRYIDRGPAPSQVIDMLIDRGQHHETIFLKGNHEAMLLDLFRDPEGFPTFKQYGGLQTLLSYGVIPSVNPDPDEQQSPIKPLAQKIADPHRRFFDDLRPKFFCGDFFFVHAGVNPGIPLRKQKEEDLLWIRDEFLSSDKNFGKFIVHGHTPVPKPDMRPNRINIDTGAYATGMVVSRGTEVNRENCAADATLR